VTDRIRHITVTLDRDYRDDDAADILTALGLVRGVSKVEPGIVKLDQLLARAAVEGEIRLSLHEAVEDVFKRKAKP
jgi:hypothetical protein